MHTHSSLTFDETWKYGKFGLNLDVTSFGYVDSKMRVRLGHIPTQRCFTLCETCQNKLQFCSINSFCREHGLKFKKILPRIPKECIINATIYQDGTVGRKFAPVNVLKMLKDTVSEDFRFFTQIMK